MKGSGKNWTQNEIAIYDILFFLDCLTLIILEMTGIVILIVKKWRIAHVNNQQHQKLRYRHCHSKYMRGLSILHLIHLTK